MHAFIFQSLPERYDLRDKLESGNKDTWYATRRNIDERRGAII